MTIVFPAASTSTTIESASGINRSLPLSSVTTRISAPPVFITESDCSDTLGANLDRASFELPVVVMVRWKRNTFRLGNSELNSDELFGCFDIVVTSHFQYDSIILKPVIFEPFCCSFATWRNEDQFFKRLQTDPENLSKAPRRFRPSGRGV